MQRSSVLGLVSTIVLCVISGCASTSEFGLDRRHAGRQHEIDVERGRPNKVLDGVGWVLGVPSKLALWDRRAENHDISPETEEFVVSYLQDMGRSDVLVRVNQYDPVGEWNRLARNRDIGLGWRMTSGTLETLKYTLLPGRVFGEDWYNPFTNTLNLYSDIPSLAVAKAAYAEDVDSREWPGTYATTQILPLANMWHETIATREALSYIRATGTESEVEEAYRVLYPSYGGSWGAGVGSFIPFGNAYARLAGSAVGHVANGIRQVAASDGDAGPAEFAD